MTHTFWKMHGAGNDFILMDDRALALRSLTPRAIAALCRRRTGIGSEGAILIQPSTQAHFRMRFFNPDGGEADMCGNGARCVARLAHELGAAPSRMTIETAAGLLRAEVLGDQVRLHMPEPADWRLDQTIEIHGRPLRYSFVNTGVPHVVAEVADLPACPVAEWGAAVRGHPAFAPAGTNVNFVALAPPSALRVRTFERGVEAETLACGTGATASALVAARLGRLKPPVQVETAGGYTLTVDFRLTAQGAADVTLLCPAEHVFKGEVDCERQAVGSGQSAVSSKK